jgi:hypothetical protein
MDQVLSRSTRERIARPAGAQNPYTFVQGGWERMILEVPQSHIQTVNYGGPLAAELVKLRKEGWKMTYSLNSTEGKTLYFKRPLARAPRHLKETIMW